VAVYLVRKTLDLLRTMNQDLSGSTIAQHKHQVYHKRLNHALANGRSKYNNVSSRRWHVPPQYSVQAIEKRILDRKTNA
jgi:hypothetical protein